MHHQLSTVVTIVALCFGSVRSQGKCDHFLSENCIDAYGTSTLDFEPLFSDSISFSYGFRVLSADEARVTLPGILNTDGTDVNKLEAWYEYDKSSVRLDPSSERLTTMIMTITNATGDVSGGNNGCDGLLGEECATNLKDILKWTAVLAPNQSYAPFNGLRKFMVTPLTNLSCPVDLFDEFTGMTGNRPFVWESETTRFTGLGFDGWNVPIPSGNASFSWLESGTTTLRPAEKQIAYAAVGVVARFPYTTPRAYDDIQVELVCVRPEPVDGSEDRIDTSKVSTPDSNSGTQNGDSGNSGAGLYPVTVSLWMLVAVIGAVFMI